MKAAFSGAVATAAAAGLVFGAAPARADLRETAERVSRAWRGAGADVRGVPSRFLADEETANIALPPGAPAACTTVALVGARGMSFRARLPASEDDEDEGAPSMASVAGSLTLRRCGGAPVTRVLVINEAGRGALETLVARSKAALPLLTAIVPERMGGPPLSHADPGDLPPLVPAARRAEGAEQRARHEGADIDARRVTSAGGDGTGALPIELGPGCHRVEVFGTDVRTPPRGRRGRLDLDAELRDEDDKLLSRDRTEASDARLEACLGEPVVAYVGFLGSPPGGEVIVTHALWTLPPHLPKTWGTLAQARMASALLARHAPPPREDAVLLVQGPSGATPVPVELEPGACYLAAVALTHGATRTLGLRALLGSEEVADDRGIGGVGSAVAFCSREQSRGRLVVEARGTALAWGLALFRVRGGAWAGAR